MAVQEALSKEKSARSTITKALAKEKGTRLTAEQALKNSDEAKAKLSLALKATKAAYAVSLDKLASNSKEMDGMVIREQEANMLWEQAEAKLADAEKKLVTAEGEKKDQELLLESAQ
jgi:chromosome segregation ATPase